MKFILLLFLIYPVSSSAFWPGMLLATADNLFVAKAGIHNGDPLLVLYQTNNPRKCRPSFAPPPSATGVPVIQERNGIVDVQIALTEGKKCGDEGQVTPTPGTKNGGYTVTNVRKLVQALGEFDRAAGKFLKSHPGVLDQDNVVVTFVYQKQVPGEPDTQLDHFEVPFKGLPVDSFEVIHMTDIPVASLLKGLTK